ncbi:MAG: carbohydrate-binding family 9-like protein [Chitinophagaceae bacterium]
MKKNKFKKIVLWAGTLILAILTFTMEASAQENKDIAVYKVHRLLKPMTIDGHWNKKEWRKVKAVDLTRYMGDIPPFRPTAQAKMMYDDNNVYLIFQVHDRYVHSVVETYNGPVSGDACVEFFFSPDTAFAQRYFNLETNAGGTPLMAYHIFPQKEYQRFTPEELDRIEIAHSLPKTIDPEITEPVTWTIEYKVPLELMEKFSSVIRPKAGTVWRANFYKTASKSTNPHWITWSFVDNPKPNFHLPQFFGLLLFQ